MNPSVYTPGSPSVFGRWGLFWANKKPNLLRLGSDCEAMSYSHRGKPPTTIGARELNFRVRYGNGCDLSAIITSLLHGCNGFCIATGRGVLAEVPLTSVLLERRLFFQNWINEHWYIHKMWLSPRPISIRQLHALPRFHTEPINLIVFEGSYQLTLWEVSS